MAPSDPPSSGKAPQGTPSPYARLVSGLSPAHPTAFEIVPSAAERDALSEDLALSELRKLRFAGEIAASGKRDWQLTGTLGATLVQPCVATLEPVVTRIDVPVVRRFLARWDDQPDAGSETEMPEDDTLEPLGSHIDPWGVMREALALEVPSFPRAAEADPLSPVQVTEPGKAALKDADLKPFAGLAALKAQLETPPPANTDGADSARTKPEGRKTDNDPDPSA